MVRSSARRPSKGLAASLCMAAALAAMPVVAQNDERFTVSFQDDPLSEVTRMVAKIARRSIVLDPRAQHVLITFESTQQMTADELWSMYLELVDEQGFAATESNGIWRIVPADSRRPPGAAPAPPAPDLLAPSPPVPTPAAPGID